jgi:hypothetical protein
MYQAVQVAQMRPLRWGCPSGTRLQSLWLGVWSKAKKYAGQPLLGVRNFVSTVAGDGDETGFREYVRSLLGNRPRGEVWQSKVAETFVHCERIEVQPLPVQLKSLSQRYFDSALAWLVTLPKS